MRVAACGGVHRPYLATKGSPIDHAPQLGAAQGSVPENYQHGQNLCGFSHVPVHEENKRTR
jgi:hypothetical protein